VPLAATLIVVLLPEVIVREVGCDVMDGAVQAAVTVTVPAALFAVPHEFETRTQ
jgi:hypothetical protein